MPCNYLYIALIEVRPLAGCLVLDGDVEGASVRCYVCAESSEEAVRKIQSACYSRMLDVVEIDWCVDSNEVAWERQGDPVGKAYSEMAITSNTVVFGEAYTWKQNRPQ